MSSDEWKKYLIDDTDVLKNKLGITDNKELEKQEKLITLKKLTELELEPISSNFDIKHLKDIHKYLFEDIYPFAGEFRICSLAKAVTNFYDPHMIEDELNKTLNELNNVYKNVLTIDDAAKILSNVYYDIMVIHPFREGNGRTTREFLRQFVLVMNDELPFDVELDYTKMDKNNFLIAAQYKFIYPNLLTLEFKKALVVINNNKKK